MLTRPLEHFLISTLNRAISKPEEEKKKKLTTEAPLPADYAVIGRVIGEDGRASSQEIALSPEARKRHLYLLGATGTGKTNLLLRLIESDIGHRRAFCVIDLRGDLVDRILLRLAANAPAGVWSKRLLLMDLREAGHVVGFNPLGGDGDPYNRALHLLSVLKYQSDSWGVQLEETLRNSLMALAEAGWSLLEIEPLLTSAPFRALVMKSVHDSRVRSFFACFEALSAANQSAWTLAVLNKITPLLAVPALRLMFGQRESFSFRGLMDSQPGMIILVSLAVDRLHDAARLVVSRPLLIEQALEKAQQNSLGGVEPQRQALSSTLAALRENQAEIDKLVATIAGGGIALELMGFLNERAKELKLSREALLVEARRLQREVAPAEQTIDVGTLRASLEDLQRLVQVAEPQEIQKLLRAAVKKIEWGPDGKHKVQFGPLPTKVGGKRN